MFVRNGLLLVAVGVASGLAVAAGLTRVMTSFLFGISPLDPTTYAAVGLVLAVGMNDETRATVITNTGTRIQSHSGTAKFYLDPAATI